MTTVEAAVKKDIFQTRRPHSVQNVALIWVDGNYQPDTQNSKHALQQLRTIVNDVNIFRDVDPCIEFLNKLGHEKGLLITSGTLGKDLVPKIHSMKQVQTIYVFCGDKSKHMWTNKWSKIRGVYEAIEPITEDLRKVVKESSEDSIPIDFAPPECNNDKSDTAENNRLEPSFMYTKIFKKILLEMKHDPKACHDLAKYCRARYSDNLTELANIDEFDKNYSPGKAIPWYTRECFLYQLVNRALRQLEADVIVNMGFYIHDVHRQLEILYQEQLGTFGKHPFQLYRGQGLPVEAFEKLKKSRKGLIAFNSFLSTSRSRATALNFARRAVKNDNMIGIVFVMLIDPKIPSTIFASIVDQSSSEEQEVLFAMHTVFRIGKVNPLTGQADVYEVELVLTNEDDQELSLLTKRLEADVGHGTGWARLGKLLIQVGKLDRAEELYRFLLEQPLTNQEKASYLSHLGKIKEDQGEYIEAKNYYKQSLVLMQSFLSSKNPTIASCYNNIGGVYVHMKEYLKASLCFRSALDIYEAIKPPPFSSLASTYNNIGSVFWRIGENEKAMSFYCKTLEIEKTHLIPNHPSLAVTYNNIATVYSSMGKVDKALSCYEKALAIDQKIYTADHPALATAYNNLGECYFQMKEYKKALSYLQRALDILLHAFHRNHPKAQAVQKSIEVVEKILQNS